MERDGMVDEIERFREVDSEELLVEEVESLDDISEDFHTDFDRGYDWASGTALYALDSDLASLHYCLGEVDVAQNRRPFLNGGTILDVPLFYIEGVVLFPGETLPLKIIQPNIIAAMERALDQADALLILGLVCVFRDPSNGEMRFGATGTTAEILQFWQLEDGSLNAHTRGHQRFRLIRRWINAEGAPCGEVQIIHEDIPLRTPRDAVGRQAPLRSLHNLFNLQDKQDDSIHDDSDALSDDSFTSELSIAERRLHESALASSSRSSKQTDELASDADENFESDLESHFGHSQVSMFPGSHHIVDGEKSENKVANTVVVDIPTRKAVGRKKGSVSSLQEVSRAFWPPWVYHMYDSYHLAQQVADIWKKIVKVPSMDDLLKSPDILSFHVASKIPVSVSTRQELLDINGISYRLRREIELLESFNLVRCKTCQAVIAMRSNMLVMSSDGPLGAFMNSSGKVHEILTVSIVNGLTLVGCPLKENSWFPGYAWTIAYCPNCDCHLGWHFTATKKNLNPQSFWGIRNSKIAGRTP